MAAGVWGELESVIPAITIPAWACAMTGRDPGQLGIYGFRHRSEYRYDAERLVGSTDVRHDAVWDVLSQVGEHVIVLGVPPGYPPRRVKGCHVGCFLTPDTRRRFTYPRELADEIFMDDKIKDYIVSLVAATRDPEEYGLEEAGSLIRYGASPRARYAAFFSSIQSRMRGNACTVAA